MDTRTVSYVPGKNSFYWKAGTSQAEEAEDQKSELFTTNLVVCGLESITLKNSEQIKVDAVRVARLDLNGDPAGTNTIVSKPLKDLFDEFVIEATDSQAAAECDINRFEIIDGQGLA